MPNPSTPDLIERLRAGCAAGEHTSAVKGAMMLEAAAALASQQETIERLTKDGPQVENGATIINSPSLSMKPRFTTMRVAWEEALQAAEVEAKRADEADERAIAAEQAQAAAEKRVGELERALLECVRVTGIDEPRFNEWHDAIADAEKLLSPKENERG